MTKTLSLAFGAFALSLHAAYEPADWNLKAREEFAGFKFGVFIHWGLYADYAQGEWYLMSNNGEKSWKESLDEEAYSRMRDGFCPSKFDAAEWVRIIKDAGAKYLTITSRHHDGFSLWPTEVDDGYNIANTPFKRDILGELSKACGEAGLQLNFYYSLMDWHRGDYPPGRCAKSVKIERKPDYASYKKFMLGQIGELIDRYHPGNIWFDGEWEHAEFDEKTKTWKRTLDWDFDTIYDFIHSKKTLVANNNHQPIREKEDIQLFERNLPGEKGEGFSDNQPRVNTRPVEQCDVIQKNVWGYRIGETDFRTPEDVATMIVKCAARNVNLLMNVGPDGSGRFPRRAVEVLAEVGKWMRANGEAIYATTAGPIQEPDRVSTRKGDKVYVFRLENGKYPVLENNVNRAVGGR